MIPNRVPSRYSVPRRSEGATAGALASKARKARWTAGLLVLVLVASVVSVRFQSRRVDGANSGSATQESEVADSSPTERNESPVSVESGLGTEEVLRRLAAIESMTQDPEERVRLIKELIRSADLKAPGCGAAFWDFALSKLTPETGLEAVLDTLGRSWGSADRSAAWAFLMDPERTSVDPHDNLGSSQFVALKGLLLEWMNSDLPGALEQARSVTQPIHRRSLLINLYTQWLASAPEDASASFSTETFDDEMPGLKTWILFMVLVEEKHPSLVPKLLDSIPQEVWTHAGDTYDLARELARISHQPRLGAAILERLPEPIARPLVSSLVRSWTYANPLAALDWLLDHSKLEATEPQVLGNLFERLAQVDPKSAVHRFERISADIQSQWAPILTAEWAAQDPRAAIDWAQARWQQGLGIEPLLRGTEAWVKTDPAAAAAFLQEILPIITQASERIELAQLWVTADPSAALYTFRTLVPAEALEARLNQALPTAAAADPLAAASAALKISDPVVRGQTVAKVGFQWGSRSPEEAIDWAASIPKSSEQSMAIRNIYRAWGINQFESATTSLGRLEPALRDQALIGIIHEHMNNSPSAPSVAASLGLRVNDSQTRAELLHSVFQRWGRSNPAEASAWLQKSALPQALQTQLKARIP